MTKVFITALIFIYAVGNIIGSYMGKDIHKDYFIVIALLTIALSIQELKSNK